MRTQGLEPARHAVYHLSHTPLTLPQFIYLFLVDLGLELRASHLQSRCSTT
jgi:hypothetical protein